MQIVFFFNDTATTEIYTLSLHDALPIYGDARARRGRDVPDRRSNVPRRDGRGRPERTLGSRSEEHTSELQSRQYLVCRLLLEKKKTEMDGWEAASRTQHLDGESEEYTSV